MERGLKQTHGFVTERKALSEAWTLETVPGDCFFCLLGSAPSPGRYKTVQRMAFLDFGLGVNLRSHLPYLPTLMVRDRHIKGKLCEGHNPMTMKVTGKPPDISCRALKGTTLLAPWSWISGLQNKDTTNSCYLKHPACGTLSCWRYAELATVILRRPGDDTSSHSRR